MRPLIAVLFAVALAAAQDLESVALRVQSTDPVVVDRGRRDRVEVGDRVVLRPREGGSYGGTVVEVRERSAVVELDDQSYVPEPGTGGEVLVPKDRELAPPPEREPPPEPEEPAEAEPEEPAKAEPEAPETPEEPAPEGTPTHPPWKNKDEEWKPGKPLLGVRPVRPRQREKRLVGRVYGIAAYVDTPEEDPADNSYGRLGTDLTYENPFGRGGRLRLNTEFAYLTEQDRNRGADLVVRRLSYAWGGDRFSDVGWEVGRFLQKGMPEFGYLDGVEWSHRRANGHRWGLTLGALPEPDEDFDSGSDLQFAGYYEWVSDLREQLVLGAGYQKTWHDGAADRDLVVLKARYLPISGWDFHGTAWVDLYTSGDALKGSGAEVTQALAVLSRRWKSGGVSLSYRRLRFPDIERNGEFLPPLDAEIADNRYDKLALDAWKRLAPDLRVHGYLAGYDDEEESGGAVELGAELEDFLLRGGYVDATVFVNIGEFEDVFGARASFGQVRDNRRWDALYEIAQHHFDGFPNDRDDLIQHRVRLSGSLYTETGWDFTLFAEGVLFDDDLAVSVGLSFQKRF